MADIDIKHRLRQDWPWFLAAFALLHTFMIIYHNGMGNDSVVYWSAAQKIEYTAEPYAPGAYLYSPAFAQVLWPLGKLPWPIFKWAWAIATGVTFAFLLKPLGWRQALPLWLCCTPEIAFGNVFWVFALVIAFGLRNPVLWAFPLLTKITPAIGPVWFLVRREWRKFWLSALAVALIVIASYLIDAVAWRDWIFFLWEHREMTTSQVGDLSPPPLIRIPAAIFLVVWGALRSRYWTIPVAMIMTTPVFFSAAFVVLAGLPRLKEENSALSS